MQSAAKLTSEGACDDADIMLLAPAKEAVGIVADPCDQTEVHVAAAILCTAYCSRNTLYCIMQPQYLLHFGCLTRVAGVGRRFRAC